MAARAWDMIRSGGGGFGPDVSCINQALEKVFARYAVDLARTALAGFSDGASYALSLGVANGDLFSHVLAFSPGFMRPPAMVGAPKVFVSHGVHDRVLPVGCSRDRCVPQPQRMGLAPPYLEFDGPHIVPLGFALAALHWTLDNPRDGSG